MLVSLFQIEVFRNIQDEEGHHLTHNFRPIQPLGDRDVYFITSFEGDDNNGELFGKDDSRLEDPPQDLSHTNSNYKQSVLTESTTFRTMDNDDGLDRTPVPEQNSNDILETTTISHRKFHKPGGNGANDIIKSSIWLIIGLCCVASNVFNIAI